MSAGRITRRKRNAPDTPDPPRRLALTEDEGFAMIFGDPNEPGSGPEREGEATLEEKREAFEFVLDFDDRAKRRRIAQHERLKNDFENGNAQERTRIIAKVIEHCRMTQRVQLLKELHALQHHSVSQLATDLEKLATQINENPPQTTISQISEGQRRREWISAIQTMLGGNLPTSSMFELCGYDGLLMACGTDEFQMYVQKTGRLRAAQQKLFDNESICDTIDTVLLCFSHAQCREYSKFGLSFYNSFDTVASAFFADFDDETKRAELVRTRRFKNDSPPLPAWWRTWGDFKYRLACKEFFRVVEANLLDLEDLKWGDNVQLRDFKEVIGLTKTGLMTGSVFIEEFEGEIATEMMCVLFRCFSGDDPNLQAIDNRMPDIPTYVDGLQGSYTYDDVFTFSTGASRKEKARAYVHRTLYTSLKHSWLLHAPAAPALFGALVRCANTLGFEARSLLPQESIDDGVKTNTPVKICMHLHREVAISICTGKQKTAQKNLSNFLTVRRKQQEKDGAKEDDVQFEPMTEEQCWKAIVFEKMWKVMGSQKALYAMGGIMTVVITDRTLFGGKFVYRAIVLLNPTNMLKNAAGWLVSMGLAEYSFAPGSLTDGLRNRIGGMIAQRNSVQRQALVLGAGKILENTVGERAAKVWYTGTYIMQFAYNNVLEISKKGADTVRMAAVGVVGPDFVNQLPGTIDDAARTANRVEELRDPWTFLASFGAKFWDYVSPAGAEAPVTSPVAPHAVDASILSIMGNSARNFFSGTPVPPDVNPTTPMDLLSDTADLGSLAQRVSQAQPRVWNDARLAPVAPVDLMNTFREMEAHSTNAITSMTSDLEKRLDIVAPRPLLSLQTATQSRTQEPKTRFKLFYFPETGEWDA